MNRVDEILVNLNANATWNDSFNTAGKESKENPAWISSNVANNFIPNNDQSDKAKMESNSRAQGLCLWH